MLCVNSYPHDDIDRCRSRIASQLADPANEVRVRCSSVLHNGGVMTADKTIKLSPWLRRPACVAVTQP